MNRWSPLYLPRVREQTEKRLRDPASQMRRLRPDADAWFTSAANQAALADLYWVSPDMAALATHAAASLTEATWDRASRPSAYGLMVFDGGVGGPQQVGRMFKVEPRTLVTPFGTAEQVTLDVRVPTEAVSWGPSPEGVQITGWLRWESVVRGVEASGAIGAAALNNPPPLMPAFSIDLPADGEPVLADDVDGTHRTIAMTLAAAWLLMEQPVLTDRQTVERSAGFGSGRKHAAETNVTLVDLRRIYRPSEPADAGAEPSRQFRHRWVVSGHWRDQPYGRERALRRRQWIPSYVKGPDGAPLLVTEKVNVWRR